MLVVPLAMASLSAGAGGARNDTPTAVLATMVKAMVEGDADTYVSIFDATEDEAKVLRAMCNYYGTALNVQKAMIDAYGEGGVMEDKKDLHAMLDGTWQEKVKIKIEGDKATATREGKDKPIKLFKKDGSWNIAADAMIADSVKLGGKPAGLNQDGDKAIKMFQAMADAHNEVMPMIGKDGKTAADINQYIGQAVLKAFFASMVMPETE